MVIAGVLAGLVVLGVIVVAAVRGQSAPTLSPALQQVLASAPWERLDSDTWTQRRKPRPTMFLTMTSDGPHRLWVHYDDDDGNIPGLSVEVCSPPASPSYRAELPGLPDGIAGSVSFEVQEGNRWVASTASEDDLARAREWLVDVGALASLPGSKLTIDASHVGGFRIHVYWTGGPNELAIAIRVAESVEKRIVPILREERERQR